MLFSLISSSAKHTQSAQGHCSVRNELTQQNKRSTEVSMGWQLMSGPNIDECYPTFTEHLPRARLEGRWYDHLCFYRWETKLSQVVKVTLLGDSRADFKPRTNQLQSLCSNHYALHYLPRLGLSRILAKVWYYFLNYFTSSEFQSGLRVSGNINVRYPTHFMALVSENVLGFLCTFGNLGGRDHSEGFQCVFTRSRAQLMNVQVHGYGTNFSLPLRISPSHNHSSLIMVNTR